MKKLLKIHYNKLFHQLILTFILIVFYNYNNKLINKLIIINNFNKNNGILIRNYQIQYIKIVNFKNKFKPQMMNNRLNI